MAEFKFEGGSWSFSAPDGLDAIGQGQRWREELKFRWNADQLTVRRVVVNTGAAPLALESIQILRFP